MNSDRMTALRTVGRSYVRSLQLSDGRVRAAVSATVTKLGAAASDEERAALLLALLSDRKVLKDAQARLELAKVQT